ncbi:MAG: right-handed parallel beta-helix repeat-containing protein [Bacteroidales bacterium]|nr:right-handed parallel beta-helix repeat-containing protein [Bacteroidales bacterium]
MKKLTRIAALALAMVVCAPQMSTAQFGKKLLNKAKELTSGSSNSSSTSSSSNSSTTSSSSNSSSSASSSATTSSSNSSSSSSSGSVSVSGDVFYVSANGGSNRNDGSKGAPFKNIQKALDVAEAGATILVAEGNYYGLLNKGNIIISKPVKLMGGYNADFSQRDILKYKTTVKPTLASNGSASGQGTVQLKSIVAPDDQVVIDGFIFDRGNSISYNKRGEGKPEGVESPMMNPIGVSGIGGENLDEDNALTTETAIIYFDGYQGVVNDVNVVVRNCTFVNCPNYGILGMIRGGSVLIENNVFVNVRMAAMEIRGAAAKTVVPVTIKNNTILFVWSRLKDLGDMGYGYRMIPGTTNTIENNIFGCAVFSALDRTHVDSDKAREALRKESVRGNVFFLNRQTDLTLPGGGMFLRVSANDFDDVEQLTEVGNNRVLTDPSVFNGKINKDYLAGFLSLKTSSNMSVDYNSTANQFRSSFGMNLQGTGSTTTSMYANRYPWLEALNLFGAMPGVGAQMPK